MVSLARPVATRSWTWTAGAANDVWRRARATRESTVRRLRAVFARVVAELPGERPDGKTIAATLAAFVIVLGLSASVLGSRGGGWLASQTPAATLPALAPTRGEPEPPAPPAAQCPTAAPQAADARPARSIRKHHVSKRTRARAVAAAPVRQPTFAR